MSDPSSVGMTLRNGYLSEVLIVLLEDISNLLLEAR